MATSQGTTGSAQYSSNTSPLSVLGDTTSLLCTFGNTYLSTISGSKTASTAIQNLCNFTGFTIDASARSAGGTPIQYSVAESAAVTTAGLIAGWVTEAAVMATTQSPNLALIYSEYMSYTAQQAYSGYIDWCHTSGLNDNINSAISSFSSVYNKIADGLTNSYGEIASQMGGASDQILQGLQDSYDKILDGFESSYNKILDELTQDTGSEYDADYDYGDLVNRSFQDLFDDTLEYCTGSEGDSSGDGSGDNTGGSGSGGGASGGSSGGSGDSSGGSAGGDGSGDGSSNSPGSGIGGGGGVWLGGQW